MFKQKSKFFKISILATLGGIMLSGCSLFGSNPFFPGYGDNKSNNNDLISICGSSKYNCQPSPVLAYANNGNNSKQIILPDYINNDVEKNLFENFKKRLISVQVRTRYSDVYGRVTGTKVNGGTAWILGKANQDQDDLSFYIATNIHVARSFINADKNAKFSIMLNPFFYNDNLEPTTKNLTDYDNIILGLKQKSFDFNFYKSEFKTKNYWEATNIAVKGPIFANQSSTNQVYDSVPSINENNSYSTTNLAADFAVLKVDFNADQSYNNQYLDSFNEFKNSLKTLKDITFGYNTYDQKPESVGYIKGFPSINDYYLENIQKYNPFSMKSDFDVVSVDLKIQNIKKEDLMNNEIKDQINQRYLINDDIGLKASDGHLYFTPTYNYSIKHLNIEAGSSGSIFVDQNFNVLGIYWGVFQQKTTKAKFSDPSYGQITNLRVKNKYDLIDPQTKDHSWDNTPSENSLCNFIREKHEANYQNRILDFCK